MPHSPNIYDLIIEKGVITRKEQSGNKVSFRAPASSGGITKVYVVQTAEKEIIYVGHTIRSMGQIALRKHTKYNYQWLHPSRKHAKLRLTVFFPEVPVTDEDIENWQRDYGEAIEAELVYLVRHHTKKWPAGQHEVHFRNIAGAKEVAEGYYEVLMAKEVV